MKPAGDVTISELSHAAGGLSRHTLMRWAQAGLIPAPRIVSSEGGKGRRGVWESSVLEHVKEIARLTRKGWSLDKIAQVRRHPIDSKAVSARVDELLGLLTLRWTRRSRHRGQTFRTTAAAMSIIVAEVLRARFHIERGAARKFASMMMRPDVLREALHSRLVGEAPVAVFDADGLVILPEHVLALYWCGMFSIADAKRQIDSGAGPVVTTRRELRPGARLVFAMSSLLDEVFRVIQVDPKFPEQRYLPPMKVLEIVPDQQYAAMYPLVIRATESGAFVITPRTDAPESITARADLEDAFRCIRGSVGKRSMK